MIVYIQNVTPRDRIVICCDVCPVWAEYRLVLHDTQYKGVNHRRRHSCCKFMIISPSQYFIICHIMRINYTREFKKNVKVHDLANKSHLLMSLSLHYLMSLFSKVFGLYIRPAPASILH